MLQPAAALPAVRAACGRRCHTGVTQPGSVLLARIGGLRYKTAPAPVLAAPEPTTLSTDADATLALAQDLIRRPSISPEDHGCLQVIGQRLEAAGFRIERMPFGPVENLWARHGSARPVL